MKNNNDDSEQETRPEHCWNDLNNASFFIHQAAIPGGSGETWTWAFSVKGAHSQVKGPENKKW
jgi:hypothetical protein